jgi:TetR/AcrR family transcriptional regulator, lmrAB and yxaGH operons repressor
MPASLATRAEVLDRIMESFRKDGYDGSSLETISRRVGLGKSSLYHHFPGGKEEMALAVLTHLAAGLRETFDAVRAESHAKKRLDRFLDAVDALYEGGRKACLLARLVASVDRARFGEPLKTIFGGLMSEVTDIVRSAGLPARTARHRAEQAIVRIEGALVVSAAMDDPAVFARTLDELRTTLLLPDRSRRATRV